MMSNFDEYFNETPKQKCSGAIHVVKEGDSLYKIAQMHNLKVSDLLLSNPYVNIYNLQVGDEICIPIKAIPVKDEAVPYIIEKGDTLGSILKKTRLTFEQLVANNPFLYDLSLPEKAVILIKSQEN